MSFRFVRSKILYILCAVGLVAGAWWLSCPKYQGHRMEWWFDRYVEDTVVGGWVDLPLSAMQKEAIEAFQSFDEAGINYLMENLILSYKDPNNDNFIYEVVNSLPFNKGRDFRREKKTRGEAAKNLITQLGLPYAWADAYSTLALESIPKVAGVIQHEDAFRIHIDILSAATNQLDRVTKRLTANLEHSKKSVAYQSMFVLSKGKLDVSGAIPTLLKRPFGKNPFWCQLYAHAAQESAEIRSKLEDEMESDDFHHAFLAALALLSVEGNHDHQLTVIESSFKQAAALENGYHEHLYAMLNTLRWWSTPLEELAPILKQHAKESEPSIPFIAELLLEQQEDISPLIPMLSELFKNQKSNTSARGEEKFLMIFFLLMHDFEDPEVWSYLDSAMAQNARSQPVWSKETALIHVLAPHSDKALAILNKYPKASRNVLPAGVPDYLTYARGYLRKYDLPPGNPLISPLP